MDAKDMVMNKWEQIRLQIVMELLRGGVSHDEVKAKAELLVNFVTGISEPKSQDVL